ncbi:hypothetical protein [Thiocapsa sp. N5-Cardenillas]|uniref:hypothetical protein n=1 Tax=Thiocapsa sp. N5-Cardenillas TaxID=3137397 RepID=UPI0035B028CF
MRKKTEAAAIAALEMVWNQASDHRALTWEQTLQIEKVLRQIREDKRPRKRRFEVIEQASGYSVRDRISGKEQWMSDGVDVLTTRTGRPMSPGSEYFRRAWERSLNESERDTMEAYGFPDPDEVEANRFD